MKDIRQFPTPADKLVVCDFCGASQWVIDTPGRVTYHVCDGRVTRRMRTATEAERAEARRMGR